MALIQATRFNRRSKDASADPLMVAASLANHRTNAQQHHLQLIDDGERGIRHLRHLTVSSAPSLPEKNRSLCQGHLDAFTLAHIRVSSH
jgi:hypothetical protein